MYYDSIVYQILQFVKADLFFSYLPLYLNLNVSRLYSVSMPIQKNHFIGIIFPIGYQLLLKYCKSRKNTYVKQVLSISIDRGLMKYL